MAMVKGLPRDKVSRRQGLGRVLVAIYAILALAALGRSGFQISTKFWEAPLPFLLSGISAAVYLLATLGLLVRAWRILAWYAIWFELIGVLVVGSLSLLLPGVFASNNPFGDHSTVWSVYGAGYLFVPLVLPFLGLWWLRFGQKESRRVGSKA